MARLRQEVHKCVAEMLFWLAARPHLRGLPELPQASTDSPLPERYQQYVAATGSLLDMESYTELETFTALQNQPYLAVLQRDLPESFLEEEFTAVESPTVFHIGESDTEAQPAGPSQAPPAPPRPSRGPQAINEDEYREFLAWKAQTQQMGRENAPRWPQCKPRPKQRGRQSARVDEDVPPPPRAHSQARPPPNRQGPSVAAQAAAAAVEAAAGAAEAPPEQTEHVLIETRSAVVGKQKCSCCGTIGRKVSGCSCRGGKSHRCLREHPEG